LKNVLRAKKLKDELIFRKQELSILYKQQKKAKEGQKDGPRKSGLAKKISGTGSSPK